MDSRLVGISASRGSCRPYISRVGSPGSAHRIISDSEVEPEIIRLHDALTRAKDRIRACARVPSGRRGAMRHLRVQYTPSRIHRSSCGRGARSPELRGGEGVRRGMTERTQDFDRHDQAMMRERVGDLTDVHNPVRRCCSGSPTTTRWMCRRGERDPRSPRPDATSRCSSTGARSPASHGAGGRARPTSPSSRVRSASPAVAGCAMRPIGFGKRTGGLDGSDGVLVVIPAMPSRGVPARAVREAEMGPSCSCSPSSMPSLSTACGHPASERRPPGEAEAAAKSGATGVGLMRTEFLVVGRANMPYEDEQTRIRQGGRRVPRPARIIGPSTSWRQAAGRGYPTGRIRFSAGAPPECLDESISSRHSSARCSARRSTAMCESCCR